MAEFGTQQIYSGAKAENDLSGKRYYFMELSAANQVDVCDGANDLPFGVLQNKPQAGEAATIAYSGITKLVAAGETITAGARLGTNASGLATATIGSGGYVVAEAITGATSGTAFIGKLYGGADRIEV